MAEEGVGIHGFGRVGQMFLRMALQRDLRVVTINDPEIGVELMASMLQRDSTQGGFAATASSFVSCHRSLEWGGCSEGWSVVFEWETNLSFPKVRYFQHPLVKVRCQIHY